MKIRKARHEGIRFLEENHLLKTMEEEEEQYTEFYSIVSKELGLGLSLNELKEIANDRTYNMENYLTYPGTVEAVKKLSESFKLGIISDTWPSITPQLEHIGVMK